MLEQLVWFFSFRFRYGQWCTRCSNDRGTRYVH